ncbi:MAG: hypothetical protein Q8Q84_01005, partial [Hydrogenophaga sp.]|nr:hypothetical protein [Hydrogenophaga sp.]
MILKKCNFRKFILISAVLSAHTYSLASCENIFSLAKTREQTVSSKSAFQAMNSNFCKEYSSARQKNQSMNAGGSYKLFSAQVGMSSESAEYIASVYCSAQDSSSAEQSAYQHYIENLSPFAYDAYSRCIAANEDIQYIVDSGKTDREFAVSINFRSGHTAVSRAEIEVSTSQGIRCSMDGAPLNRFVFEAGASRT